MQEFVGTHGWQRVEPELGVVGLAAPAVLVLRAIVDQQQQPGGGQALDQAVEQGLGLGVDPVQILEHQQQRLHLAFAQQHALQGVERAPAPLRRVQRQKRAVLRQGVQERQQGGMVSCRAVSSVSTCPVTLARMVRVSSRSSTWT